MNDYRNERIEKNENNEAYKLEDLNQNNIKLYINKEKREFSKFLELDKEGYYYIKLVFNKKIIVVEVYFYIVKI